MPVIRKIALLFVLGLWPLLHATGAYAQPGLERGNDSFGEAVGTGQEVAPIPAAVPSAAQESAEALPEYAFDLEDGLYATITAEERFDSPDLSKVHTLSLGSVKGFENNAKVYALWQKKPAPLAVCLLGLSMSYDDKMAALWQHTLYEAGYHVLTFDSPFRTTFNQMTRHGPAGHMAVEAQLCANLVAAVLKHKDVGERVTSIGLFGASYGGVLALNMARLAEEQGDEFPFKIDAVLAFSPPAKMRTATRLVDEMQRRDRPRHNKDKLMELVGAKPVKAGKPVPFSDSQMRAGLAFVFNDRLSMMLKYCNQRYRLGVLEKQVGRMNELERDHLMQQAAETWLFVPYIERIVYPYYHKRGEAPDTVDAFWNYGDVDWLLARAGEHTQVVLTRDDPLSDPAEVDALKSAFPEKVTVHAHGGHLGYVHTKWARARMKQLLPLP